MPDRSETMVTLFGGGGFIGRYVAEELLAADVRIKVAGREPRRAHRIQPLGRVGQWGLVDADVTRPDTLKRAVEGADAVINLVGSFADAMEINGEGAGNVARAARDAGVRALVHVSAIGANRASEALYHRSKARGEALVREAFPDATIIRPSLVFGPEDQLTNRFAALAQFPVLPVIAPGCRFQPVYVEDLARAIAMAALHPRQHAGKTYEIGGPEVLSMRELVATIARLAGRSPTFVELPDGAGSLLSRLGFLPGAPITRDQWLMLQQDNVVPDGANGLQAFGITPTPLGAVGQSWLGRFWRGGRFAMRSSGGSA
jgi:uncharacterized protein YbjT (DUF2867 family)